MFLKIHEPPRKTIDNPFNVSLLQLLASQTLSQLVFMGAPQSAWPALPCHLLMAVATMSSWRVNLITYNRGATMTWHISTSFGPGFSSDLHVFNIVQLFIFHCQVKLPQFPKGTFVKPLAIILGTHQTNETNHFSWKLNKILHMLHMRGKERLSTYPTHLPCRSFGDQTNISRGCGC